jgi:hypothetical protein
LPKRRGQFKGEKRRKELNRLQKQQEKRQRRFGQTEKEPDAPETEAGAPGTETVTEKQEGEESPTPIAQP